ncbi:serine hydrolase [uncultured Acetatifactor sp.]|uniref:serine hydrolase n=1 Tax=uncultured Acetatifactor sp. TaxID=1671927 RepID=UPI0026379C3D|nr:serine hydrolase [uncultured Acetatifactor sp.]
MERGEIEESLRHISGRTSVYYRNLVTGATIGIREKLPMMAASVIKIPILVEAFHQIRTGEHTKNEIYVLQEGDKRPSCGCLNRMHAGLSVTYEDLCNLMIILSDNSATNILIRLLGGMDRINEDLREMGYETLQVNRLLFDREASERGIQNYVSAAEIGDMLERMYRGKLIDLESSGDMLDILKEQRLNGKFPFRFRGRIPIAHKTGEDDGITHDVGIFYAEEPFVLCCLGNETDCPAFDRFMQDLAWRFYEERTKQ